MLIPYVKSVCIHTTVERSLRYILNPDKTEDCLLTASINCTTDSRDAYLQMKTVYNHFARDSFDSPPPLNEKQRQDINEHIEEYNRMVSLLEQAQLFDELSAKDKLSDAEQLQHTVCRQAMKQNGIHSPADVDSMREKAWHLGIKISALKDNLEGCRKRYDVYSDITKTYGEISKGDYISNLVEEEKQRREKDAKKKRKL